MAATGFVFATGAGFGVTGAGFAGFAGGFGGPFATGFATGRAGAFTGAFCVTFAAGSHAPTSAHVATAASLTSHCTPSVFTEPFFRITAPAAVPPRPSALVFQP